METVSDAVAPFCRIDVEVLAAPGTKVLVCVGLAVLTRPATEVFVDVGVDVLAAPSGGVFVGVDVFVGVGVDVMASPAGGVFVGVEVFVEVGVDVLVDPTGGVFVGVEVLVEVLVETTLQTGPLMMFEFSVTAPVWARRRPLIVAPVFRPMDVRARILPWNLVVVSRVAEEPTLHQTLQGSPPVTEEPGDVISVEAALNIQTPDPLSVRLPLREKATAQ